MEMLHSPAAIIAKLLVAAGAGSDPPAGPWPVFVANEPTNPSNCVTVYNTAGTSDGRSMLDGAVFTHPGIQVRVRSDDESGWLKAEALRKLLAEGVRQASVVVGDATYTVYCCARISNVIPLGKEAPTSKRSIFVVNCTVALRRAA